MSDDVYIFYAKRTPIGRWGGALSYMRVDDILAELLKDFKSQFENSFPLREVSDVLVGCANQAGEDNRNLARMSLLLAGFPFEVPGMTVNRLCASSLDALLDAYARIKANLGDCFLVGGAENMTRAPWAMPKADRAFGRQQKLYDTALGWRFENPKMKKLFPLLNMGQTAERVARKYKIHRKRQDEFALSSHKKAIQAQESKRFVDEILALNVPTAQKGVPALFSADEGPRKDTSLEKLAKLRGVFPLEDGEDDNLKTVTAGNSSSLNDGAALLGLANGKFIKKHNLIPLAKVLGGRTKGLDPSYMGLGPVQAIREWEHKDSSKISLKDMDLIELNEAFSAQALACSDELGLNLEKVNVNGGAIALGHPLGCSGARIVTTLVHEMGKNVNAKLGLASMCVGVGQGVCVILEKA